MRWRLLIEEFGPNLIYIKGANNIVADALSRMAMTEEDFSAEAFAGDAEVDFPTEYPLSYPEIAHEQSKDKEVTKLVRDQPDVYTKQEFRHSDDTYRIVTRNGKCSTQRLNIRDSLSDGTRATVRRPIHE